AYATYLQGRSCSCAHRHHRGTGALCGRSAAGNATPECADRAADWSELGIAERADLAAHRSDVGPAERANQTADRRPLAGGVANALRAVPGLAAGAHRPADRVARSA